MTISLSDAGKRYNREWIFRHFTYLFEQGKSYAVTGPNGSGKSTLLQAIAGSMHINEGTISYAGNGMALSEAPGVLNEEPVLPLRPERIYKEISICAPYLELVEEMNLKEFFSFHSSFKPMLPGFSVEKIAIVIGLDKTGNKQIRYYSSGMKQRVKLAQSILSDVPVVLLDEPCTNLDAAGFDLYRELVRQYCRDRLLIVSSNDPAEYEFCEQKISISDYK